MDIFANICGLSVCVVVEPDFNVGKMNMAVQEAVLDAMDNRAASYVAASGEQEADDDDDSESSSDGDAIPSPENNEEEGECVLQVSGADGVVFEDDDTPLCDTGLQQGDAVSVVAKKGSALHLRMLADTIHYGNDDEKYLAVQSLRQQLSKSSAEGWAAVIPKILSAEPPVLPKLIACLESEDDRLLHEAVWTLSNLCAGGTRETKQVVRAGALPHLVRQASSHTSAHIRETSAWCLGNMAGDTKAISTQMVEAGGLRALSEGYLMDPDAADVKKVASWAIGYCVRTGLSSVAEREDECRQAALALGKIVTRQPLDAEDTGNAWDSLSRLTRREGGSLLVLSVIPDVADLAVRAILDSDNLNTPATSSDTANATLAAVQLIADLTSEDDPRPTQAVIDAGLLGLSREMHELFDGADDKHRPKMRDSLFLALSNISSGTSTQRRYLLNDSVVWDTIELGLTATKPSIVYSALVTIQELLEWADSKVKAPGGGSVADFFLKKEKMLDAIRHCLDNMPGQQAEAADKIFQALVAGASPGTVVPDVVTEG
eukprot:Rhum_TRINITY_DN7335_c0_g1::Rhum_TRINITY_DN7335_c0_g1_i1::g.22534::m.22534